MLRCRHWLGPSAVPATDGASRTGSGPSRRSKVGTDETADQPPTNNCQDSTRGGDQPLLFSRNTCAVSVADESTTARPGQDRMGTGHVRPSRPPVPPVPRRGVPSIAQCVESWDCETPMRIYPQGPHSSAARPWTTRSIPTQRRAAASTAAAPRPIGGKQHAHPIPRMQNGKICLCSCASPRDGGGGTALAARRRVDNSSLQQ
jgi:hypothetical protein